MYMNVILPENYCPGVVQTKNNPIGLYCTSI